jgi:Transposase zinc-binding domain
MNFKGIKKKILRFKLIFKEHWSAFVFTHPRYDTNYYQAEVGKMLTCGSEAGGFAIFQCLRCGEGEHKVHFSCKGKACPLGIISMGYVLGRFLRALGSIRPARFPT